MPIRHSKSATGIHKLRDNDRESRRNSATGFANLESLVSKDGGQVKCGHPIIASGLVYGGQVRLERRYRKDMNGPD